MNKILFMLLFSLLVCPRLVLAGFIDNGNETVSDTNTCLQWQKLTMDVDNDGYPDKLTWEEALDAAENLDLATKNDWRLPSINELRSLLDFSRQYPAIDPIFSDTTSSSFYWSSTSLASYGSHAWLVHFGTIINAYDGESDKTTEWYVRAVRGGECTINTQGLAAAISLLQVMTGKTLGSSVDISADVNGDGILGWAEVVYILKGLSTTL